ncbi:MAG: hypothetical protein E2O56_06270 [Gammaproteobacteria bacterium]|nr:MAG: hypothetical protein E2O56_06270 [Gammaproteobacteria bacterium]
MRKTVMMKREAHKRLAARKWSLLPAVVLLVLMSSNAHAWGYGPGYGYGWHGGYRHGGGYAAGAFVLGGLLGYAISSSSQPRYVVAQQPVYAQPRYSSGQSVAYGQSVPRSSLRASRDNRAIFRPGSYPRYYLRDADGNCYLVNTFENGDETWTAVPAVNCQ